MATEREAPSPRWPRPAFSDHLLLAPPSFHLGIGALLSNMPLGRNMQSETVNQCMKRGELSPALSITFETLMRNRCLQAAFRGENVGPGVGAAGQGLGEPAKQETHPAHHLSSRTSSACFNSHISFLPFEGNLPSVRFISDKRLLFSKPAQ